MVLIHKLLLTFILVNYLYIYILPSLFDCLTLSLKMDDQDKPIIVTYCGVEEIVVVRTF